MKLEDKYRGLTEDEREEPRRNPLTAGERARAERDLRMGAHPIQGERENDAFRV